MKGCEKRLRQESITSGGKIEASFQGLTPATSYQYAAFLSNGKQELLSGTRLLTTAKLPMPELAWTKVAATTADGATINAGFTGAEFLVSCSLLLWEAGNDTAKSQWSPTVSGSEAVFVVKGLKPESHYRYSIVLSNGSENSRTEDLSFTTLEIPFSVEVETSVTASYFSASKTFTPPPQKKVPLPEIAQIDVVATPYSATLSAVLTETFYLTEAGVILYYAGNNGTRIPVSPAGGSLEYFWDNLTPGTQYSFSVFCGNGYETFESPARVFNTPQQEFDPGLLEYLLANFDTNADGAMSQSELQDITEVILSDTYLKSLRGMETLVNLKSLSMGNNWLETIDLSANKKLEFFSGSRDPHLKHIIIDNPELYYLYLLQSDNLKTVDISRCPKLSNFECYQVKLETMDFSHNGRLTVVFIYESNLKELDLSANWNLLHLGIHDNPLLETMWLKKGIIMESVDVDSNTQILYK